MLRVQAVRSMSILVAGGGNDHLGQLGIQGQLCHDLPHLWRGGGSTRSLSAQAWPLSWVPCLNLLLCSTGSLAARSTQLHAAGASSASAVTTSC